MEDVLFTVKEVSKLIKTSPDYVYKLINLELLPALKLGSYKVRKTALLKFLEDNEGKDLTDPTKIKYLRGETSNEEETQEENHHKTNTVDNHCVDNCSNKSSNTLCICPTRI